MGEGFEKLKKQRLQSVFIKSAVCGVSFGLFAVGAVLLALKLAGIPLNVLFYVLIGVGAAAAAGGVTFLILKPADKKLAKELDAEYCLDEKVQSALAFQGAEGAVAEMLQTDTNQRLLNLPKQRFNFKKVWQFFLIGLLSVAVILSALLVPSKFVQGESEEDENAPYALTEKQMDDLLELIEDVKTSSLEESIRGGAVNSLNKLLNNLTFAESNGEMKTFVNGSIQEIEKLIKTPLSYKSIANALGGLGQNELARMIADGAQVYKDYALVSMEKVEEFYSGRVAAVTEKLNTTLTKFFDSLQQEEESETEEADGPEDGESGDAGGSADSVIARTFTDIYTALTLSGVDEDDLLHSALFEFARGLARGEGRLTNATALRFDLEFNNALAEQAYRLAINLYIADRLRVIFGLSIPADENFVPIYSNGNSGGNENEGPTQGGYGKGDMLYGSDDAVYDPSTGEYVKYGELFNDYYAIVEELLREGNLTEEQQAVIRAYFEILLSGLKEEE